MFGEIENSRFLHIPLIYLCEHRWHSGSMNSGSVSVYI